MALPPQILEDSTETLEDYAPLEPGLGALSSVTVRVRTPSTSLPAVDEAEAATADSVSTTIGAAASKGATSITVASATGIAEGRQYAIGLGAVDDDSVVVKVRRQVGTTLTLTEGLPVAVAQSDTLKGFRVSHALTADETETSGEGLAVWKAAYASGETRTWDQQFWVVRQRLHHTLTVTRLTSKYPQVLRLRPPTDEKLQEVIDAAWEDRVIPALEGRNIDVWTIKSAARLEPVVATACVLHLVLADAASTPEYVERAEKDYESALELALRGRHFWIDAPDDRNPQADDDTPDESEFTGYTR